ncbi:CSC1-like protein ERD4 [Arachis ipaensis]|uniref:CSC1-like protein ERD4 n=1 Tax=Arachis ipaensis TaxID=130454 RepID=UPI0007AEEC9C|nr:CSC1-like protein ERD4 [Arachis ipaensis]
MIVTDHKKADKIWEELEGYKKNLARAEAVFEKSKATTKPEGTRTTSRTGLLGLCGSKVDSIEYYNEKINETVTKLEAEQKVALSEISNKMLLLSSSRTGLLQHQQLRVYMLKWLTIGLCLLLLNPANYYGPI